MLGSLDANRGDYQNGWDTDQFPTDIYLTTTCMLSLLKFGGLAPGGINFDAKVRRESFEPVEGGAEIDPEPVRIPTRVIAHRSRARAAMSLDKKVRAGQLRFVLMRGIGAAFVTADYPAAALENTLRRHFG